MYGVKFEFVYKKPLCLCHSLENLNLCNTHENTYTSTKSSVSHSFTGFLENSCGTNLFIWCHTWINETYSSHILYFQHETFCIILTSLQDMSLLFYSFKNKFETWIKPARSDPPSLFLLNFKKNVKINVIGKKTFFFCLKNFHLKNKLVVIIAVHEMFLLYIWSSQILNTNIYYSKIFQTQTSFFFGKF